MGVFLGLFFFPFSFLLFLLRILLSSSFCFLWFCCLVFLLISLSVFFLVLRSSLLPCIATVARRCFVSLFIFPRSLSFIMLLYLFNAMYVQLHAFMNTHRDHYSHATQNASGNIHSCCDCIYA